jgi:hypothetical protein
LRGTNAEYHQYGKSSVFSTFVRHVWQSRTTVRIASAHYGVSIVICVCPSLGAHTNYEHSDLDEEVLNRESTGQSV